MTRETIALVLQTLRLRPTITIPEAQSAWSRADLRGLNRLLAFEGAQVWLYRRLKALEVSCRRGFVDILRQASHQMTLLGLRVDAQTCAVLDLLGGAGIPWALIKGQARRAATERYRYGNARAVVDVDLLVPAERADQAWQLLRQNGYEPCYADPTPWKVTHHLPALWNENRVAVELHITTADAVPASEAWRRATARPDFVSWNGHAVAVPSATELLWQALAHSVQDGSKGCRLSAFLNGAAVLAEDPPIQWRVIGERMAAGEVRDQDRERPVSSLRIRRWLATAADLAGIGLPPELGRGDRVDLPRLLLWRGKILSSQLAPSVRQRFLEEAARREVALPVSKGVKGTRLMARARRRSASLVARVLYTAWRTTAG